MVLITGNRLIGFVLYEYQCIFIGGVCVSSDLVKVENPAPVVSSQNLPVGVTNQAINDILVSPNIANMWGIPAAHIKHTQNAAAIVNTKHGLASGVPIICKDTECPYVATCRIDPQDRIRNTRCPMEIGALISRFEQLCHEFGIGETDYVDLGQIKELVDLEIMMLRCDNKMAIDASFIETSVKDIAKSGDIIYEDKISLATELKLTIIDKHSKILKDLNGTRSSKGHSLTTLDASLQAASLMERARELEIKLNDMSIEILDEEFYETEDAQYELVEEDE